MIYHLIYISETTPAFNETSDMLRILAKSRDNNQKVQVTGLLIKKNQFFIQVLEGKQENVKATYNRIAKDPRHKKINILLTYQDADRIFPTWAMGIKNIEKNDINGTELLTILHSDLAQITSSKEKIVTLLKAFNNF